MEPHLLPIGEMSRRSGLGVSALRFYDRHGLLPPARVDPVTGYRRYQEDQVPRARMLAGMRRVQMPLAEMAAVLEAGADTETVRDLLGAHVRRLERGLEQARTQLARVTALVGDVTGAVPVDAAGLGSSLRAVRYAVSTDPRVPELGGVLLECLGDELRVVATDRYRLALASIPLAATAPWPVSVVLAADGVDDLLARLPQEGQVELVVAPGLLRVHPEEGAPLQVPLVHEADYPDYRVLLEAVPGGQVMGALGELARALDDGLDGLDRDDVDDDAESRQGRPAPFALGERRVDRTYLREAVEQVGPGGQLRLPSDLGPWLLQDESGSRLALVMPLAPERA